MSRVAPQQPMTPYAPQGGPPAGGAPPSGSVRPRLWEMALHPFKTLRFMGALASDPRIPAIRKLLYVAPVTLLVVAVLLPEGVVAAGLALLVPLVGPLVGLPADAAINWLILALAAYGLLSVLPEWIVREHHQRIFHPRRLAR